MSETQFLNAENIDRFRNTLLTWFENNKREFPWRETKNPFHILIAEKLLQQTVAREAVISTYNKIISRYPTPQKLSEARLSRLEELIQPLGLKYRSLELITMAKELVWRHNGNVPDKLDDLLKITGVGDYSARAVLSFAYQHDTPIVDVNIARLIIRIYGIQGLITENPARNKELRTKAKYLLPVGRSRDFNLAELDLCAKVCKTTDPRCSFCPIIVYCCYGKNLNIFANLNNSQVDQL